MLDMPRSYKKITFKTYTNDDLVNALDLINKNEITAYSASARFKIPYSTLMNHLNGSSKSNKPGKPTLLTMEEEVNSYIKKIGKIAI